MVGSDSRCCSGSCASRSVCIPLERMLKVIQLWEWVDRADFNTSESQGVSSNGTKVYLLFILAMGSCLCSGSWTTAAHCPGGAQRSS